MEEERDMSQHPDEEDVRVRIELTPQQSYEFIQRLASDGDFRARLTRNPHQVLGEHGIHVPPNHIPTQVTLPPEEELRDLAESVERWGKEGYMAVVIPVAFPFGHICITNDT